MDNFEEVTFLFFFSLGEKRGFDFFFFFLQCFDKICDTQRGEKEVYSNICEFSSSLSNR